MESATIEENLPTSPEESMVKFSQASAAGKKDEKPDPVSVMLSPPKCEPELGEITHVDFPTAESDFSKFVASCELPFESITIQSVVLKHISSTIGIANLPMCRGLDVMV